MALRDSGAGMAGGGALRAVRRLFPDAALVEHAIPLGDQHGAYSEQPQLREARVVEGGSLRAIRVVGEPAVKFAAFLDGVQRARMMSHWQGIPIITGVVAAVVRVRVQRRTVTWGHRSPSVRRALYVPLRYLPVAKVEVVASVAEADGFAVVDTAATDERGNFPSRHPAALHACALERVRDDRERLERELAEEWCARESGPIYIDGGISGSGRVAAAACAVGVVKSHQTIFADGDALRVVLTLPRGWRSSVFNIEPRARAAVASWYLRMHDPAGHDATFGLVRVEVSRDCADLAERANEVSRWILAEAAPLALPDSRWDRMAYGIRDCEEFLRAISW